MLRLLGQSGGNRFQTRLARGNLCRGCFSQGWSGAEILPGLLLSDLGVAVAAVYWSVSSRLEGDFRVLPTLGAHCREHLATWCEATAILGCALCSSCLTTSRAALRLVRVALGPEEFLLVGAKGELDATIDTLKCLVLGNHTG